MAREFLASWAQTKTLVTTGRDRYLETEQQKGSGREGISDGDDPESDAPKGRGEDQERLHSHAGGSGGSTRCGLMSTTMMVVSSFKPTATGLGADGQKKQGGRGGDAAVAP